MAGKRVAVLDPDGNFGTVDEADVESLPDGARVLTKQQLAAQQLEDEYAAKSTGQKVVQALAGGGIGPQSEAFLEGARGEFSAGLAQAGSRVVQDAIKPGAGQAYAEHLDTLETGAHTATGAGRVAGMAAGLAVGMAGGGAAGGGVARALPLNAVSALGAPVEAGVAKAMAGVAAKGVLGRAASTGAKLAARGAVEGAAYAGLSSATDSVVHDTPIVGEKLFAAMGNGALTGGVLGGALGVTGSLAASGVRGAAGKLRSAGQLVNEAGEAAEGTVLQKGAKGLKNTIGGALKDPSSAARSMADEQAWKAVGGGFGLQSTRYAKQAQKYFGPEGTKELGGIARKYGAIDMGAADASPWAAGFQAAKSGTPADILPKLEGALEGVGKKIGDIAEASQARIPAKAIEGAYNDVRQQYAKMAGFEHVVRALDEHQASLGSKMVADSAGTVRVQDALEQRKFLDKLVYEEAKTLDPKGRVAALREFRTKFEEVIADSLDSASGKVPGKLKEEYKALKRDYHGLRILSEAAEDSAARASKAATLGMTEKLALAGSIASGHLLAAPVLAAGSKFVKERGNAAVAAFLTRAADSGAISRTVEKFNARLNDAAMGVLKEAPPGPRRLPARSSSAAASRAATVGRRDEEASRERAQAIVKWVGDTRANPTQLMDQLEEASVQIGRSAGPIAAESYTGATLRAVNFIAAHVPAKERRDPLDPRSVPPLSREESDRLIRATKYALQPESVFADFERGLVTPEGLRAAQTFLPESFAEFQEKLFDHVQDGMLKGRRLSSAQRLRIDKLLQSAAGPDLRPRSIAKLQADFAAPQQGPTPAPQAGGPVDLKVQQSGFDAVEARMMG